MKVFEGKQGLVIILAFVAIGYFALRRGSVEIEPKVRTAPKSSLNAKRQEIIEAPKPQTANVKALDEARRNYNIVTLNGIVQVPALLKNNKLRVTIEPKPEAQWCKTGDFDLMKALATNTSEPILTLSLESMQKDGLKRSQTYSLSDLNSNKDSVFELPAENGAYGLYLCTDSGKQGSCSTKQPIPKEIWAARGEPLKKLAANKVFYFQLIHVKNKRIHVIPSNAWGKKNLNNLKFRIGDWMGDDATALDRMDALVSQIQPMPARLLESKVEIPLPYNDMRCLGH